MGARFVIGRAGSGKSHHCFEAIVSALRMEPLGGRIYWLLPQQATFTAERELTCAGALAGFCRARVLSFSQLCDDVLAECGGSAVPEVTRLGRQMVLGHLLRAHATELRFFGNSAHQPGLAAKLEATLAELDRTGKDPAQLEALVREMALPAADADVDPLAAKLHDLHLLYKAYAQYLGQERLDPRRRMDHVLRCISTSRLFGGATVYVDEFSKLEEFERRILARLARTARVEVTLLMDPSSPVLGSPGKAPQELSLFHPAEQTYCQLVKAFADEGVAVEPPLLLETIHRFAGAGLAAIERKLFADGPVARDGAGAEGAEIELVEAPDRRAEVNHAARAIRQLVARGLRYREIALLVRQLEPYHDLIAAAFGEHGIPYFVDRRRSMAHHPLLQFLRSALAIPHNGFPHDAMMGMLKSGLAGLELEEADRLENYVLEHRLRGAVWGREEAWAFGQRAPVDGEEPAADDSAVIDALRRRAVDPLRPLLARLPTAQTALSVRELVVEVFGLFERYGVGRTLGGWIARARAEQRHEQAAEHEQAWEQLVELFDEMVDLLGEQPVTLADFGQVLDSALETIDLAITPVTVDQVLVGQIDRTRTPDVKAVLLLGLNDGVFPSVPTDSSVLSDGDRMELARRSFELDPCTERLLLDEHFLAYVAFTRGSQHLYASRSISDDAGRPLGPSPYWRRLRALFPALAPVCLPRDERTEPALISTPRQLLTALMRWARGQSQPREGEGPHEGTFRALYQFLAMHPTEGDAIDAARHRAWKALTYDNRAAIGGEVARRLFASPLTMSVAQVEAFATCPFRHFAQYVLRLEPREEEDALAINLDAAFRRILEDLVREMLRRGEGWESLSPQQAEQFVRFHEAELAATLRGEVMLSQARNRYLLGRLQRDLAKLITSQQAIAQRRLFRTAFGRTDFGPDARRLPALAIRTPGGCEIHLTGRMDRIDTLRLEGQVAAAIMDYRLNKSELNLNRAYYGLSLQLLVSLLVVEAHGQKLTGLPVAPAGAFQVRLLRQLELVEHPEDAPRPTDPQFAIGQKHRGIFDAGYFDALDTTPDCVNSDLIAARKKKDGSFGYKGGTDVAEAGELGALLQHVRRCVGELGDRIIAGRIEAWPFRMNTLTPCPSCRYKSVCRFDPAINRYNHIPPARREEILARVVMEAGHGA